MRFNNISSALLGLLISLSTFAGSTSPARGWLDQLALQGHTTLFTGPSATAHSSFLSLISQARTEVTMEMYHMTDRQVVDALVSASKRGVDVKVILDGKSLNNPAATNIESTLETAGVKVIKSSPGFSITHSKALTVDGKQGIVSSMNLTSRPDVRRDYGVVIEDQAVIAEMQKVFEADITNAEQQTANTPDITDPHLIWSPVNANEKMHALIASARTSIVAVAENILDANIVNDLVTAAKHGVQVRVLSPACPMGGNPAGNYNTSKTLANAGIEVRQMPDPATPTTPYLHGKMMVIDNARAYVGSINYSFNSLSRARELGIALSDQGVVTGLSKAFDDDFGHAESLGPAAPNCASAEDTDPHTVH